MLVLARCFETAKKKKNKNHKKVEICYMYLTHSKFLHTREVVVFSILMMVVIFT